MLKSLLAALAVVTLLACAACGHPPAPNTDPHPSATTVLNILDVFSAATTAADTVGAIDHAVANEMLADAASARATVEAGKSGWQAAVKTAWQQAEPRFSGVTNQKVKLALAAVTAVVTLL
jgi:hypothetical protein